MMMMMQASVYKLDFEEERQAREKLNDRKIELEQRVEELEAELGRYPATPTATHRPMATGAEARIRPDEYVS